jgi:hypothetical protein
MLPVGRLGVINDSQLHGYPLFFYIVIKIRINGKACRSPWLLNSCDVTMWVSLGISQACYVSVHGRRPWPADLL